MDGKRIEYAAPTSRAMGRMTTILFRPFQLGRWFVIGFSAWLATMTEQCSRANVNVQGGDWSHQEKEAIEEAFRPAIDYVKLNLDWLVPLAVGVVVVLVVLWFVLLWVGSRGKFMLLDNVVHNRALVKQPWREYRREGNSLYRWQLLLVAVALGILLVVGGGSAVALVATYREGAVSGAWVAGLIGSVITVLLLFLGLAYVSMLLENFVIPEMYKHRLDGREAWRRVGALHRRHPARFFLFALWLLLLLMAAGFVTMAFVLITCRLGGILLLIPYLGAVISLPITLFFRALGPEFLRQFGQEHDLWENAPDPYGFEAESPPPPNDF